MPQPAAPGNAAAHDKAAKKQSFFVDVTPCTGPMSADATDVLMAAAGAAAKDPEKPIHKYNGVTFDSVAALLEAVQTAKRNGKKTYWGLLEPVIVTNAAGEDMVKVVCGICAEKYSVVNIAQFANKHFINDFTSCKQAPGDKQAAAETGSKRQAVVVGTPGSATGSSKRFKASASNALTSNFAVPATVADQAKAHLFRSIFSNPTISLSYIEDPELVASYRTMGITLPCRKTLTTTILNQHYNEVREAVLQRSFGVMAGGFEIIPDDPYGLGPLPVLGAFFSLATDGWRRKAAAQGIPLINVMVLPDEGPAVFLTVSWEQKCSAAKPCEELRFSKVEVAGVRSIQTPSWSPNVCLQQLHEQL
jgi:hypothetical protein